MVKGPRDWKGVLGSRDADLWLCAFSGVILCNPIVDESWRSESRANRAILWLMALVGPWADLDFDLDPANEVAANGGRR